MRLPLRNCGRYEDELYRFIETRHPTVFTSIADKKITRRRGEGGAGRRADEFNKQFLAGRQAAAAVA